MTSLTNLYTWLKGRIDTCGGKLRLIDEETLSSMNSTNTKFENDWFLSIKSIAPRMNDLASGQMELELGLAGVWSSTGDVEKLGRILSKSVLVFEALTGGNIPAGCLLLEVVEPAPLSERMGLTIVEYTLHITLSTVE